MPEDLPAEPHIKTLEKRNPTPAEITKKLLLLPSGKGGSPSN
jgi:hypothetical protein